MIYQTLNLWCLGKTRQSLAVMQQAENAALATGHDLTIGYVHMHAGMTCLLDNQGPVAANHIGELERIGRKHNLAQFRLYSEILDALVQDNSESSDWIEAYYRCETEYDAINARLYLPIFRTLAGWKAINNGQVRQARAFAVQARQSLAETGEAFVTSELCRLEGALALSEGKLEDAETNLKAAIATARQQGAKSWELRAATDLARLWQAQGRIDEAISLLGPVHTEIVDRDCPDDQTEARELFAALVG